MKLNDVVTREQTVMVFKPTNEVFYEDGMGVFGDEKNDVEGVDVSLVEGVLVEDECNIIDKIEIGGRILFVNDYR